MHQERIRGRAIEEQLASVDFERAILGKRSVAKILQPMVDRMKKQNPPKKRKRRKRQAKVRTVHYSRMED